MKLNYLPLCFDWSKKLLVLLLLFGIFPLATAWAKTEKPNITKDAIASLVISKASLQVKIDSISTRQGLDEAAKSKIIKLYQSAQNNLNNIEAFNGRIAAFKQAIKQAPEQTKRLQKEIELTQPKLDKQKLEDFSVIATEELEQRLIIEKEKISNLDEQLKKLENELALQNNRPQLIRQEMATALQDIDASQKKLAMPTTGSSLTLEAEAEQLYLKTLMDVRTVELKMLDIESISNPSRVELIKTQYQLLDIQKAGFTPVVAAIENSLADRKQQQAKDAQDALAQTENELSGKHPAIQEITKENIQYSKDLQQITGKIDSYNEQKIKFDAKAAEIDNDFKSAEKKIGLAGLSPALGKILREQRRNLVTPTELIELSETIQNETALTSLEQFKVEDNLKKLVDINTVLHEKMVLMVDQTLPEQERMRVQAELRVLMNTQKDLLNKLSIADSTYLRTLGDFDFARQQMVIQAGKFSAFLDERLLWVPSSEPINGDYLANMYRSSLWLLSPFNWISVINDSLKTLVKWPFITFLAIASLSTLLLTRKQLKHQLAASSDMVGRTHTDQFYYTLSALVCVFLLILPAPLFVYYWGWFLTSNFQATDFSKAIGTGLQAAAIPLLFIQYFYRLFAPAGVVYKHFQWQSDTIDLLHRQIAWLRFIAVPTVFIISATAATIASQHSDSLGRLALIVSMIAMAVFLKKILSPSAGILKHAIIQHPNGWLNKSRYFWYPSAIIMPLVIIGFAVAGYYLSALELQQKLIITLRLIFMMVIIHELVFRWLTLVNGQLAIENAQQLRRVEEHNIRHHVSIGHEDPALPVEEQLIDIPKINAQTIKLLNVFISFSLLIGFWLIWQNILPAFSFLDRIVLWQHEVVVDNQEILQPVTLTNLLLVGLYLFVTVVSVLNFSGLMELLLFRRMNIETGSRYAINQLAKYLLVSIGFISIANELGGSWSQVQWLVAALGVGLGFGLQEIFANLVSGIILLFERPIRVGDTVTIGDITGKVSRIQMRATTIIDWDQKELIVPNKSFITNQLVNWTLSDSITRIVIPISIAYGTDVDFAHQILMDTVHTTPMVLSDPEPCVLLMEFGESSMNFSVRVFVSEMSNRLPVIHDLHIRLVKALNEHQIEIPLPQREVFIRTAATEEALGNRP